MIQIDFTTDKITLYIVLGLLLWASVVKMLQLSNKIRSWKNKDVDEAILELIWEVEKFRNLLFLISVLCVMALIYVVLR